MCKVKKICLVLAVTVSFLAGSANALNDWLGGTSSDWLNAANWAQGIPSGSSSQGEPVMNWASAPAYTPVINSAVPDVWVIAVAWTQNGTLDIAPGASVYSNHWVLLGHYAGSFGTVNMTGGSLTVTPDPIMVGGAGSGLFNFSGGTISTADFLLGGEIFNEDNTGFGTVNMSGGTLTANALAPGWKGSGVFNLSGGNVTATALTRIAQTAGETGTLTMTGGTVTTGYLQLGYGGTGYLNLYGGLFDVTVTGATGLEIGSLPGSVGYMDITEGVFTIAGDAALLDIQNWIADGSITAYGGAGTVLYDYDITNPGKTTVWAIPEPATIVLIGIGSVLGCFRKKRTA